MERHDAFVHFQSNLERSGRSGINFSIRAIECYTERKGQLGLSHGICDNSIDLASFLSERGRPACILQKIVIVSRDVPDARGTTPQIGQRNLHRRPEGILSDITRVDFAQITEPSLRSHRGNGPPLFFFDRFCVFMSHEWRW